MKIFNKILCENAPQVVEVLRGSSKLWDGPFRSWIFRGQRDNGWRLTPSIFRKDNISAWLKLDYEQIINHLEFMDKEIELIKRFVKCADAVGLKIPGDCYSFRTSYMYASGDWPPKDYMEIFAIAQHHGIPTRLLDFTHDGLIASYFAAHDVNKERENKDKFTVWAINIGEYYNLLRQFERSIQMASVPTFDNNYLYSQKGIFIYDKSFDRNWNGECKLSALRLDMKDTIIEDINNLIKQKKIEINPLIYKIEIPKTIVKDLLVLLHKEEINFASLMPTYDGVVKQIKIEDSLKVTRM